MQAQSIPLRLHLEGALVLTQALHLQSQLRQALESASDVWLDVSGATEFDLSFLQLLIAAHKMAKTENKTLTVATSGSEALAAQVERCGLPASVLPDFRDVFPS